MKNRLSSSAAKNGTLNICISGIIAALYVALTYLALLLGLANGPIQLRFSEALCILPYFTPAAIPGVTIGCFLANILTGATFIDIIFGSLATLIGAVFAYILRKRKWLVPVPTIVANTAIIPFILKYSYNLEGTVAYFIFTIFIGELLSVGVIGMAFLICMEKRGIKPNRLN